MNEATLDDLDQFCGTENWYKNPMFPKFMYTDGVKYVAEKAGAYWLIDAIFSHQASPKVNREEFQSWTLQVDAAHEGVLTCDDGNGTVVAAQRIPFTDFPLKAITFWFTNNTLLLPTEY